MPQKEVTKDKKRTVVERLRVVIIALNIFIAAFSLVNLSTLAFDAIRVDVPGEDDFSWVVDTRQEGTTFKSDFTVTNHGIYDIYDLDIEAVLLDGKGRTLIEYAQEDLLIKAGEVKTFTIAAFLPFEKFELEELLELLARDSVFYLDVDIHASFMWGFSEFSVDDTIEQPWEAPLKKYLGNDTSDALADILLDRLPPASGIVDRLARAGLASILRSLGERGIAGDNWVVHIEGQPPEGNTTPVNGYVEFEVFGGYDARMDFAALVTETEEGTTIDELEVTFDVKRA